MTERQLTPSSSNDFSNRIWKPRHIPKNGLFKIKSDKFGKLSESF